MQKAAFNNEILDVLIQEVGFDSSGDPFAAAALIHRILSLAPFHNDWKAVERLLPDSGRYHLTLYMLSDCDLLEHGSGVGGSWMTDKGKAIFAKLNQINWDAPPLLSPSSTEPRLHKFATQLPADLDGEDSLFSNVVELGALCGCGSPEDAMALELELLKLAPFNENSERIASLLPEPGLAQFIRYQLGHHGIVDREQGKLTARGELLLRLLERLAAKGYEDPYCP